MHALYGQDCINQHIEVVGSVKGGAIQELSREEFLSFRANSANEDYGIWLVLVTNLNGKQAEVHIIDPDFFSSVAKTHIRPKYGVHEAYSRYHAYSNSSSHYVQKVLQANGALIPFEIILPLKGGRLSEAWKLNWVLKNRRYKYVQSSKTFSSILIKAEGLIRQKLLKENFKGAFVDYDKPRTFQRPNSKTSKGQRDIGALKSQGYSLVTIHQLNELLNKDQNLIHVLNKGAFNADSNWYESYGTLRYINNYSDTAFDAKSYNSLSFRDIAIFSELPENILPVAGILVLEPQTELSHVNILARNRGTLNVSLNATDTQRQQVHKLLERAIVGYKSNLMNKPVRLVLSGNELLIKEISQQELTKRVAELRARQARISLAKPIRPKKLGWLVRPAEDSSLTVRHIGAKAANYGLLERILGNEFVLPGYAIGFDFYFEVLKQKSPFGRPDSLIQFFLSGKDTMKGDQISLSLKRIREAIQAIPITNIPKHKVSGSTIITELACLCEEGVLQSGYGPFPAPELSERESKYLFDAFDYRSVGKMRFRSSTNCEDLPLFNGAGLYQSQGCKFMQHGVRHIDSLLIWQKLKNVLSSLWLERAFYEREYFRMNHRNAAMGIQINPAFSKYWLDSDLMEEWANGVALYQEKGGKPVYTINSQIGSASVTNPIEGELSESFIIQEDSLSVKALSQVGGQVNYIFIGQDGKRLNKAGRREELLEKLMHSLRLIFTRMIVQNENPDYRNPNKYAIDIEYKVMWNPGSRKKWLFIKQARPLRLN